MVTRQKVRIILKSFEHKVLDSSTEQIVETAERTGARVAGPVPLPTHIRRFALFGGPTWTRTRGNTLKSGPTSGSLTSLSRRPRLLTRSPG